MPCLQYQPFDKFQTVYYFNVHSLTVVWKLNNHTRLIGVHLQTSGLDGKRDGWRIVSSLSLAGLCRWRRKFPDDPAIACLCLRDTCFQASSDWQMKIIRNMGLQDEIVVQHGREGERRLLAGQAWGVEEGGGRVQCGFRRSRVRC